MHKFVFLDKNFEELQKVYINIKSASQLIREGFKEEHNEYKGVIFYNPETHITVPSFFISRLGNKGIEAGVMKDEFVNCEGAIIHESLVSGFYNQDKYFDFNPYIGTKITVKVKSMDDLIKQKLYAFKNKKEKLLFALQHGMPNHDRIHEFCEKTIQVTVNQETLFTEDGYTLHHKDIEEIVETNGFNYDTLNPDARYEFLLKDIEELVEGGWDIKADTALHEVYGKIDVYGMIDFYGKTFSGRKYKNNHIVSVDRKLGERIFHVDMIKDIVIPTEVIEKYTIQDIERYNLGSFNLTINYDNNKVFVEDGNRDYYYNMDFDELKFFFNVVSDRYDKILETKPPKKRKKNLNPYNKKKKPLRDEYELAAMPDRPRRNAGYGTTIGRG